ncbi:hypothetical protein P152DRAFT_111491 [Eremomyces bilateralis CBS 781.70]|uniref:Uncharacterized protein n=1 Tax=Eremomyces bilateralis CBS 781.70 TaxID=1392243 RepID=A0A6G1GE10_9PEZI|nr:uncharacterized protein P152DRAFT_111491 [Eremomyces bilateralis CBS 781.70]KAF1816130.1 hypothetical protein P152DRAFT_111491 [Eremomyces bilateralis CBS 781.70]
MEKWLDVAAKEHILDPTRYAIQSIVSEAVSDCFRTVLCALSNSSVQLEWLLVYLDSFNYKTGLLVENPVFPNRISSVINERSFLDLTELHMDLDAYIRSQSIYQALPKFLSLAPKLESLSLSSSAASLYTSWVIRELSQLQFPCLKSLELNAVSAKQESLSRLLLKHRNTFRKVALLDVCLCNPEDLNARGDPNEWHVILQALLELGLECFSIFRPCMPHYGVLFVFNDGNVDPNLSRKTPDEVRKAINRVWRTKLRREA